MTDSTPTTNLPSLAFAQGSSQADRLLAALNPDYVSVDERSLQDMLAFVRDYAKQLRYFNLNDKPDGDWQDLVPDSIDLSDVVNFVNYPDTIKPENAQHYHRPHFVLLLSVLKLLEQNRANLNTLTQRHLDFYYRDFLRLRTRPAQADHVHVLLEPAKHISYYKLPALTRLNAGKDSSGKPRIYQTDRDVVVSHANIAELRTLRADTRHIDVRAARERHVRIYGTSKYFDAFMEMLKIAYGEPLAGDALPDFVCHTTASAKSTPMDGRLLGFLHQKLSYISNALHMSFSDFEECVTLRLKRTPPPINSNYADIPELESWRKQWEQDWKTINGLLNSAGKERIGDTFTPIDELSTDFEGNFEKVIGALNFDGLPNIENLTDLYQRRHRNDTRAFIQKHLSILKTPDQPATATSDSATGFECLMQIKTRMDNEWSHFYDLIEQAIQTLWLQLITAAKEAPAESIKLSIPSADQTSTQQLFPAEQAPKLNRSPQSVAHNTQILVMMADHLNHLNHLKNNSKPATDGATQDPNTRLVGLYQLIRCLESYTALSAFEIKQLMDIALSFTDPGNLPPIERWQTVDTLLEKGSAKKRNDRRKQELIKAVTDDTGQIKEGKEAVAILLSKLLQQEVTQETVRIEIDRLQAIYVHIDLTPLKQACEPGTFERQEWQKVYQMLASAWGMFRGERSKPEKSEWQNLYAFEQAKASTVSLGIAEDNTPRWNTFGGVPSGIKPKELAEFGWALSSPLLLLNEGKREITLTLSFNASNVFEQAGFKALFPSSPGAQSANTPIPFKILISTGTDWLEPSPDSIRLIAPDGKDIPPNTLSLRFSYPSDAAAIAAPATGTPLAGAWPVLKLLINPFTQDDPYTSDEDKQKVSTSHYALLKSLKISRIHLKVGVKGLKTFQAWNDERTVDPTKPFEPFGTRPAVGSRFYVTHPELVCKKLSSLIFKTEWMDAPTNTAEHYRNYPAMKADTQFKANISVYEPQYGQQLTTPQPATLLGTELSLANPVPLDNRLGYERQLALPDRNKQNKDNRYIQWELQSPDFQHGIYSKLALEKSTSLAVALSTKPTQIKPEDYQVNPPYTPKLKALTLDYVAEETINCQTLHETHAEQLFHLEPFGYMRVQTNGPHASAPYFLPQFNREGSLYIGIEKLTPPQNLSLLFQVAEGSADANLEPARVEWHYLSGNVWRKLDDGSLISDATRGLIHTGIIEFSLKPAEPNTLLPAHLYWLRASVVSRSGSVCNTVDIHCQAVSATFVDQGNAPDHYQTPLPVDSISKLEQPRMEIKSIRQPYTSYGAKQAEQDEHFYVRASERLRHKNRALTIWDYERLILEQFPAIYRAKCIPAEQGRPGDVRMVVIPDIKNRIPFDPFEPKVPLNLLEDIKTFLSNKAPAAAHIDVRNAVYIPLIIRAGICFKPGMPNEFNKKTLNQALDRFFSPWAFENSSNIKLGGEIHVNNIIKFIEDQECVDFVSKISLFKIMGGRHISLGEPDKIISIIPSHPDEIFVSSSKHEFEVISDVDYREVLFDGLGNMRMELDFHINS